MITHLKLLFGKGTNDSSVRSGKYSKFRPVEKSDTKYLFQHGACVVGNDYMKKLNVSKKKISHAQHSVLKK